MGEQPYLSELSKSLKDWERYQLYSIEDLNKDRDTRNMVLHAMLVSIQAAIDIAIHLISKNDLEKPAMYRESFDILGKAGLISNELASELSDLAGLRDVLIHACWTINLDDAYFVLQKDLTHLNSFKDEVKERLNQNP